MINSLIVIPTYNEIENIETILTTVFNLYNEVHVLVVDDNSPDQTGKRVFQLQKNYNNLLFLLQRKQKKGLGTAYIDGFKWALKYSYQYIFQLDADFSHNPKDLKKLFKACNDDGADLAIGSRYINGVNVVNWPIFRIILSYGASKYVRLFTGMPIADPTAGFVCYKRKVLEAINLDNIKFIGYAFQIEMKFKTYKMGYKIIEIPIIFKDRIKGRSKMSSKIISEAIFGVLYLRIITLFKT